MHPKNEVQGPKGKYFDWDSDYKNNKGHNSDAHVFLKKKTRRFIRRDGKKVIKKEMESER